MERRLAAVLAADVVGYTRIIGADEAGALVALRAFRAEVFGPTVAGHHGRIVKSMGDGWLVEFSSVVEAVNCAVQVQDRLTGRSPILGIGIALANFKSSSDAAPLRNAITDALRVSASDAHVLHYAAWCSLWCGETSTALDCFRKFERFGKAHPFSAPAKGGAATASLQLGDDATAIRMAHEGLELSSTYATLYSVLAAAYANSGQPEKAAAALSAYRELVPDRTISSWKAMNDYGGSAGGKRYFDGLRKAGLPE